MIDIDKILNSIMDTYRSGIDGSEALTEIAKKIENGNAYYGDVLETAIEHGKILSDSLKRHLPDALDGQTNLSSDVAKSLIKPPMISSTKEIAKTAGQVQKKMNHDAGINIAFMEPDPNEDQIDGIITGLCNSESYDAGKKIFEDRVGNFLEGYVDDCVRDNAAFQYGAGLSPKIERIPAVGCCEWCSQLAGTYDYNDVSGKGNNVFRRHRNCHCQVLFHPVGSKQRQNVHTKRWTEKKNSDNINKDNRVTMNLELFGKRNGKDRANDYADGWQKASLSDAIKKFAPGSKGIMTDDGAKTVYTSDDGLRSIVYDNEGNYFRIRDNKINTRKNHLNLNGQHMLNIMENGKQRGTHNDEYEQLTHFLNADPGEEDKA